MKIDFTKEELISLKEALECYCAETDETDEDISLMKKLEDAIDNI